MFSLAMIHSEPATTAATCAPLQFHLFGPLSSGLKQAPSQSRQVGAHGLRSGINRELRCPVK